MPQNQSAMSPTSLRTLIIALFCLVLSVPATTASAAESYFIDTEHSEIRFAWSHGGVSVQSGEFTSFEGDAVFDEQDFSKSSVTVKIKSKSAVTGIRQLDGDLRSPYYLSVKEHPEITFVSKEVRRVSPKAARITGDLTLRGITKRAVLEVELHHQGEHPMGRFLAFNKGKWLGISATTSILRSEYGMDSYIPVVSDRIKISIVAELKARSK